MPMGGHGQRFLDGGYTIPKPLITVDGKEMFLTALSSFEHMNIPITRIFVIRRDQEDKYGLASKIQSILPKAKIVFLEKDTKGATETALLAKPILDQNSPVVVLDCDMKFYSKQYFDKLTKSFMTGNPDGILLTFPSKDSRYSYAKTYEGRVIQTAEKKVISKNAIAGAYYFSTAKVFIDAAEELLSQPITNTLKEYYVSLIYNILISEGKIVEIATVDKLCSFGTPEELVSYGDGNAKYN